jgi:hypothetical protein
MGEMGDRLGSARIMDGADERVSWRNPKEVSMLYLLALLGMYHLFMRHTIRLVRPLVWAAALAATAWLVGG